MLQEYYHTPRLRLLPAGEGLAPQVLAYYRRNRAFLKPYESTRGEEFFTLPYQCSFLAAEARRADEGMAARFFLTLRDAPKAGVIGLAALSNIVLGPFRSAWLGYSLEEGYVGQGLMQEALQKLVEIAFTQLGLHRLEANIMPRNIRSLNTVKKLGFTAEGLAKQYLEIDGRWEDHLHMVLLNQSLPPGGQR